MRKAGAQRQAGVSADQDNAPVKVENTDHIQFAFKSTKLLDIEEALNRFVAPERLIPVSRERFIEGRFRFVGAPDLGLFNVHLGSEVVCELPPEDSDERVAFVTTGSGISRLVLGGKSYDISQQHGVFITSGETRALSFTANTENQVLLTEQRKIAAICGKLLDREISRPVKFDVGFNLESPSGQSWMNLFRFASTELENERSFLRCSAAARKQMEDMILTGLLLGHANNYSDALLRPQPVAAPFYVKRAEAFIEAHSTQPLSLADIAAHAGVSARSLQSGFQTFRGMTPMAFLRSIRLRHAHERLRLADPTTSTVTEIALVCGFNHIGEFGRLYKRAFGVTPSHTLLKKA